MPIAQYPFDGPHRSLKNIEDVSGVFAILCEFMDKYYLLDIDHSDSVKQAIQKHDRKRCWEKYKRGRIRYAVLYDRVPGRRKRRDREEDTVQIPQHSLRIHN